MRYFGSKSSTLPQLSEIIGARVPRGTLCDAFGGIGTVGAHFKTLGYHVWTGDVLEFAHYFQITRIQRQRQSTFRNLKAEFDLKTQADIVSALSYGRLRNGWFVQHYAIERKFFTLENARKIERMWKNILAWRDAGLLSSCEYAVLITSLICAMDQVANTAGTYYAYLKTWHRKAQKQLQIKILSPARGAHAGTCHLGTAETLVEKRQFDVLYLDPPYNDRSYPHYYHLPETVACGTRPRIHGLSGIPIERCEQSTFNKPKEATNALKSLLMKANFKWLAFHYADDGLIPKKEIHQLLCDIGEVEEFALKSRGYTTKTTARQVSHRLYMVKHG